MENIENNDKIKIIIADDEIKTCNEIKENLSKCEEIEILGIANTDDEEIKMIEELKPEIVITDLKRKDRMTGFDIIKDYSAKEGSPKFIIVSFAPDSCLYSYYNNIAGYVKKFLEINYEELIYKIKVAKGVIELEKEEFTKKKILEEQKKKSFIEKLKMLILN